MREEAMRVYVDALQLVGNPSSIHGHGQHAKMRLEEAREILSSGQSADPVELIYTSGGTESINTAIKGLFRQQQLGGTKPVIIVPEAEHHATFESVEWLEKYEGAEPVWIPVDHIGMIDLVALEAALEEHREKVALITALWANNEVGTVQPVEELAELATRFDTLLHLDAVAAFGYIPTGFLFPGISAVSMTSHKIGGPSAVGALLLRRNLLLSPLLHGGSHERKLRSGSQPVAAAVGFAKAFQLSMEEGPAHVMRLRNRLVKGIQTRIPDAILTGAPIDVDDDVQYGDGEQLTRVPGNAHFLFPGAEGDVMLFLLDQSGFSVSTGSACQAGVPEVSHVLQSMGFSETEAKGALRFTLGDANTEAEVDALLAALPGVYEQAKLAYRS